VDKPAYITLQKWKLMQEAWKEETQVGVDIWKDILPRRGEWQEWRAWYMAARVINKIRRGIK
jgi:hypothetical protein